MNPDEVETRMLRLETQQHVNAVLLHVVVRTIPPEGRRQILRQFEKMCRATEAQLKPHLDQPGVQLQQQVYFDAYAVLEETLRLIEEHEKKRAGG